MTAVREVYTDLRTGETIERMVDMPDVLSHEEALAADLEQLAVDMRAERDRRLVASDWTMLADAPIVSERTVWITYRQALRDVTAQPGFPAEISWPTPPG